jgi:hypothetical protein
MSLELPTANFANWKKYSANYYYPQTCDDNNHIHVACEKIDSNKNIATISSVSIKISGKSTNLRVGNATNGFKFHPEAATFPADPTGAQYKQALRNAGVIA